MKTVVDASYCWSGPPEQTSQRNSRILLRQTVAAVFVLELLGNRQRAECELLVNKTAVGETEAATATHPQRKKQN